MQAEGLPPAPVLADAGYGDTTAFREGLTTAGLPYVVGMKKETTAWPPGEAPRPPKRWNGRGRPPTRVRRTATHTPQSLKQLALALPAAAWRTVTWREGTRGAMRSRVARLRVRPAHRDEQRAEPRPEEWLLIEWPRDDAEPTEYWLSTLPASTSLGMSEVGASGPHPSSTRAKRGSAARHSASGSPSSRRTMLAPRTIETIL